jgi:tetratricopeptide (TPR) repeat protein
MLFNDQSLLAALPSEDLAFWRASGDWRGLNDALHTESLRAVARSDYATARALQQENVALCQRMHDEQQLGAALFCLAINVSEMGDFAEAEVLFPETIQLLQSTGDNWTLSYLLGFMGDIALRRDDYASARVRLQQAVALFHQVGDSWSAAHRLRLLGRLSHQQNDTQAAAYFRESFSLFRRLGDRRGSPLCLSSIAEIALVSDAPHCAARLLGVAAALLDDDLSALSPDDQAIFEQTQVQVRAQIGEALFAEEWRTGQRIALEFGDALRGDVKLALSAV